MQKVDVLRNDVRKAEKSRRELESKIEDALTEAANVSVNHMNFYQPDLM